MLINGTVFGHETRLNSTALEKETVKQISFIQNFVNVSEINLTEKSQYCKIEIEFHYLYSKHSLRSGYLSSNLELAIIKLQTAFQNTTWEQTNAKS